MLLLGFLHLILAHEDAGMSVGELLISVGLLVLSAGIAASMLLLIFLKPVLRVRRQWKEGRLPSSSKTSYLVIAILVALGFMVVVWKFAWAAYYDIHFHRYEEKLEASGKHPKKGVEYKWNRWHIYGRYAPNQLALFIDDVLEKADPKKEIQAFARLGGPSPTDWQPMTWDDKQKAFVATFKPQGEKMELEFRLKSGWSTFEDKVIGYVPRNVMKGHEGLEVTQ
jgi:hypothetical protein